MLEHLKQWIGHLFQSWFSPYVRDEVDKRVNDLTEALDRMNDDGGPLHKRREDD